MTDQFHTEDGGDSQPLPDNPELALFVAGLFQRLGGRLSINGGQRFAWRPEPVYFRLQGEGLPQLPDAQPHERFHSVGQWRGALKVADYWLSRLSAADKELVFTLFAPVGAGHPERFDFRERLP